MENYVDNVDNLFKKQKNLEFKPVYNVVKNKCELFRKMLKKRYGEVDNNGDVNNVNFESTLSTVEK